MIFIFKNIFIFNVKNITNPSISKISKNQIKNYLSSSVTTLFYLQLKAQCKTFDSSFLFMYLPKFGLYLTVERFLTIFNISIFYSQNSFLKYFKNVFEEDISNRLKGV